MLRVWITGDSAAAEYSAFIDNCITALFYEDTKYDIEINFRRFVDDEYYPNGTHLGFCTGDKDISVIEIATHGVYECGEEYAYQPFEIASTLAHELTHARQYHKDQINMANYVWKVEGTTTNCVDLEYEDQPWEVEAYSYEKILTDIYWR
jgi:hypothetical protein